MHKRLIAGVIAAATCGYIFWQILTPVEIVAAHNAVCSETGSCHSDILLVKNFPYLKSRQITWWKAHRDMIKKKYGIPHKNDHGYYQITIMGFGKGYRTEPNESLLLSTDEVYCFNEMVTEARCIDRDNLFSVDKTPNGGLRYQSY